MTDICEEMEVYINLFHYTSCCSCCTWLRFCRWYFLQIELTRFVWAK